MTAENNFDPDVRKNDGSDILGQLIRTSIGYGISPFELGQYLTGAENQDFLNALTGGKSEEMNLLDTAGKILLNDVQDEGDGDGDGG
jgi:hypothetical protein